MAEPENRMIRARLRAAQVEITAGARELELASSACDELEDIAASYRTSGLQVMALHARGLCLLLEGRREEALPLLKDACRRWQDLDSPYQGARARTLLARLYRALGDPEAAALEMDAAASVFEALGAAPDLRVLEELRGHPAPSDGLTAPELEVLSHLARGSSNRQIAAALFISEKTVARHLSNIFTKLGVSSRTAAAAYAVEHGLLPGAGG
jgi:ATP/maltotriose-dependent transcriptional regulator MalT